MDLSSACAEPKRARPGDPPGPRLAFMLESTQQRRVGFAARRSTSSPRRPPPRTSSNCCWVSIVIVLVSNTSLFGSSLRFIGRIPQQFAGLRFPPLSPRECDRLPHNPLHLKCRGSQSDHVGGGRRRRSTSTSTPIVHPQRTGSRPPESQQPSPPESAATGQHTAPSAVSRHSKSVGHVAGSSRTQLFVQRMPSGPSTH